MKRLLAVGITLISTILAAHAADLQKPVNKAPAYAAVPAPWSGFYGGVSIGYGIDTSGLNGTTGFSGTNTTVGSLAAAPNGWLFGGRIGYDWYLNPIVFGLETDLQYSNFQAGGGTTINPAASLNFNAKTDWWGSANARFGVPIGDSLLYGIGGLAYGDRTANGVLQVNATPEGGVSLSGTQLGWDVGAGIGTKLTPNSEVFFEYRYIDLGSLNGSALNTTTGVTTGVSVPMTFQTFMIGYNLHL